MSRYALRTRLTGGSEANSINKWFGGGFVPPDLIDFLVVAGGGGGYGHESGGGGGAGGLRSTVTATGGGGTLEAGLAYSLSTNYTVTVGAGGSAGSPSVGNDNTVGSNSVFSTITSTGGGKGFTQANTTGKDGGSGGAARGGTTNSVVGNGTANQGFNSGLSQTNPSYYGSGGGGGAGAVGSNGTNSAGGAGGAGVAVSITGTSTYYGGGGGGGVYTGGSGGAGGTGGGGAAGVGGYNQGLGNGTAGTVNTGGGGGGASILNGYGSYGGAGGSGIVVLRYPLYRTITIGAGLTGTTFTSGSYTVATITAGTGNVSWA